MPRAIDQATITALESSNVRWLILVKIEFDEGTIAFNSTLGDYEYDGLNYVGFGTLGELSKLEESANLDPQTYVIGLSGINPTLLAAVINSDYLNRPATAYIAPVDENNDIIGEPILYFQALVDSVSCIYGSSSKLTVTVKDILSDWNRKKTERYTDQDQQSRYPGDKGFEFVSSIANKEIIWPNKSWYENQK